MWLDGTKLSRVLWIGLNSWFWIPLIDVAFSIDFQGLLGRGLFEQDIFEPLHAEGQ